MKKPTTYNAPGFQIGKAAASHLAANVATAEELAQILGVTLPKLARLGARGIVFRFSHGQYHLSESVANYIAYKSAPRASTYAEALAGAQREGYANPEECARRSTGWKILPSDDINTVRTLHDVFFVPWLIDSFQTELRFIRINHLSGKHKPEHFDIAAEETFQLMRRVGLNDSRHKTFLDHCSAWDKNPPRVSFDFTDAEGGNFMRAEAAARTVAAEERDQQRF